MKAIRVRSTSHILQKFNGFEIVELRKEWITKIDGDGEIHIAYSKAPKSLHDESEDTSDEPDEFFFFKNLKSAKVFCKRYIDSDLRDLRHAKNTISEYRIQDLKTFKPE